jgi:hypothetical protein
MERRNGTSFDEAYSFGDAADIFVNGISSISSTQDLKKRDIQMFTSDYALYWFDYLAGYDTVFAELAWNHSSAIQIGLCRGAAHAQGKDWGAIITWTYDEPPYLASGPKYSNMLIAYETGAKYIIIFSIISRKPIQHTRRRTLRGHAKILDLHTSNPADMEEQSQQFCRPMITGLE